MTDEKTIERLQNELHYWTQQREMAIYSQDKAESMIHFINSKIELLGDKNA